MDKQRYEAPKAEVVLFEHLGVDLPLSISSEDEADSKKNKKKKGLK